MTAGVLAIWHDVVTERQPAVLDWYNREHHPERVSIPGFRSAARYRGIAGQPEFFICYQVDTPDVLASDAYLDRVNNPTDWTRRSMPFFRNNSRTVCRTTFDQGGGSGAYVATFRFTAKDSDDDRLRGRLAHSLLPGIAAQELVVRVQLWEALLDVTTIQTVERGLRSGTDATTAWCVVVEASSLMAVQQLAAAQILDGETAGGVETGIYALEFYLSHLSL